MNRHLHRLVFDRRRGMLMAVAECVRACGKAAAVGATSGFVAGSMAATPAAPAPRPPVTFASKLPAPSAPLPQVYGSTFKADGRTPVNPTPRPFAYDPAKGAASADLSSTGQVSWRIDGTTATFDQGNVARVVLNWDSFNIGTGYTVQFKQNPDPSVYVSALNRIWNADPTVILGALKADREVILVNANGVYFGRGARVDTSRFVASALNLADSVFEKGLRNVTDGSPVFSTAATGGYAATNLDAGVGTEAGAELRSAAGGDVLLIAPRVLNQGRIETPQGQAVLAAGDKVYLMSSSDPKQRGLIVAVDPVRKADGSLDTELGIAENAAADTSSLVRQLNEIRAESGTVNLVGLTVRQNGSINATTAVKGANGAIYLQAMASTTAISGDAGDNNTAARGIATQAGTLARFGSALGTVAIGSGSVTAVLPDASPRTQIDAEVFNPSLIHVEGKAISVAAGAQLRAPGGRIDLLASASADANPIFFSDGTALRADDSRVVIAPGALLSTAGAQSVAVDGTRNQGSLRLFRIELADAPVQRSGPLYRSPVLFDLRDGSKVKLADVSGAAASVGRTAAERATAGGTINIQSDGALVLGQDATLDVSGGSVAYSAATLRTTLVDVNGHAASFAGVGAGTRLSGLSTSTLAVPAPAYTEGADGGSLQLNARQMQLAGQLLGSTTLGERQRDGRSSAADPAALVIGRHVETSYYLGGITLGATAPAAVDPSIFAEPLSSPLAGLGSTLTLSLQQVAAGGFGSLQLHALRVAQPGFGTLDLGAGGVLDIDAGTAALNGRYTAAGGRIAVNTTLLQNDADTSGAGDLTLSADTRLDTAGLWTNHSAGGAQVAGAAPSRPQNDGGSVKLAAAHSLRAAPGAVIDVSGGAQLSATGTLTRGTAGTLSLGTSTAIGVHYLAGQAEPVLSLAGVTLRGYDFAGGGKLVLGVPELTVGGGTAAGFQLPPEFFASSGFGSISVNALGGVRIASGTTLAPQLLNWQLGGAWRAQASGAMSAQVATPERLDPQVTERKPVNLALAATRALNDFGGADLSVERGATIELDPGATLALSATRNLSVGASGGTPGQASRLSVPGGTLTLAITGSRGGTPDQDKEGFIGSQALWLGADARLSVDGTAQQRGAEGVVTVAGPDGTVWGGGSINLNAARGYVVAEAGSMLSMNGASAMVNLAGADTPLRLAKAAGSLNVSTPEGFVLDGKVSAQAPRDAAGQTLADGGVLNLSVGLGGVNAYEGDKPGHQYPSTPRLISVGDHDGLLAQRGATFGSDLSGTLGNGTGYLRSSVLQSAGLGALQLGAGDAVRFDSSLSLTVPTSLQLNAPAIAAAPGAQVVLSAATARLGDLLGSRLSVADTRALADTSAAHDTTLTLAAPTIDVVGNLGLQGFSAVNLDAGAAALGEIRFSAYNPGFGFDATRTRQLNFAGSLTLAAAQVYATSATQYTLAGLAAAGADDPGSRLIVRPAAGGTLPAAPLSAFGALTIEATDIDQGGALRQPFGQIRLQAERELTLRAGSVTSVSGAGASELFGQTINLADWSLPGGASFAQLPLGKGVSLDAAHIVTEASAQVSAAGGGTLRAWEFFPGVGGSKDTFDLPNLYAVLPDYAATQALSLTGGLLPASALQQIVITLAGSGLAPGRYSLMQARYALLAGDLPQGAFLVSRAADQGKSLLRVPLRRDDGGVVVTGYVTSAGSANVGAPGERFVVEPASTFQARSDIRLSDVSELLANRAAAQGNVRPALPRDGGAVQIAASGSATSTWRATLDLGAATGQAGTLDIAARQLALLDDLSALSAGAFGISAQSIADSEAGSVLLGGRRSAGGTGSAWTLDASGTQRVSVDLAGKVLKTEELLLASAGSIELAAGTQIDATGTGTLGARVLQSHGDGALVAVSANALQLQRSDAALAQGDVRVGAGSLLAGHSVGLDATGALQLDRSTHLQAQALTLGAATLRIGAEARADAGDTVLSGPLLDDARQTGTLNLRGYRRIDLAGVLAPSDALQQRLVLDTPLLRGVSDGTGAAPQATIRAQDLLLQNTTGGMAEAATGGQGSLVLQALPPLRYGQTGGLTLGPGAISLAFDDVTLRSAGDIVLQGSGQLSAPNGLSLLAARLTATTGAEQSLTAGGLLHLGVEAGSRTLGERVGVGASLQLSGTTLQQDGRIELPGGNLALLASGGPANGTTLRFGTGSLTSVAGFVLSGPNGFNPSGAAGRIEAEATTGRIELLGTLDASAAGSGDAGRITLRASGDGGALGLSPTGQLLGRAGGTAGDLGGQLRIDVAHMASADMLARAATAGGMTGEFNLRVRSGDVALGESVSAQRISVAADGGTLTVGNGTALTLDARAPAGGVVQLAAGGDLLLASGVRIDARSSRSGANGGDVLLSSSDGRLRLASDAVVNAGGDDEQDGRIVLRAGRDDTARTLRIDRLAPQNLQAGEVDIEAVRTYEHVESLVATGDDTGVLSQATVRADNNVFMSAKPALLAGLGLDAAALATGRYNLRAGVEVRADGDLMVSDDWVFGGIAGNANRDRPGGDAGFLTLRAAGNLLLGGSLSDGFSSSGALNDNARSWSFRIAAGADLAAANPLAVSRPAGLAEGSGSLVIDGGKLVRTGAGSIEMAAGRDIVFGDLGDGSAPGLAYVAGRRLAGSQALLDTLFRSQRATPQFTEQGGRLELVAGGDVVAPEGTQFIGNWFWRSGLLSARPGEAGLYAADNQLAWWTQSNSFGQTLGSFGGGNLRVEAGRDLVNVQALAPTAGWADQRNAAAAVLRTINGGDVTLSAGRDLLGGQFLLGRGEGRLLAGRSIGAAVDNFALTVPALALMDGTWRVTARGDVDVLGAFNPTAAPPSGASGRASLSPYFYTWGSNAAMRVVANAGRLAIETGVDQSLFEGYGLDTGTDGIAPTFNVLPQSLFATAASGDLLLGGVAAVMFPSARGQLQLYAGQDLRIPSPLAMADSAPASWPSSAAPTTGLALVNLLTNTVADSLPLAGLHAGDAEPARLHAEGSLLVEGASKGQATLMLPKAAQLSAGLDVRNLSVRIQNLNPGDTSTVQAVRNFLAGDLGRVELAGPGTLDVSAGGSIDLGASAGLTTTGNQRNASLPAAGASIHVAAATAGTLDVAALAANQLAPESAGGSSGHQQHREALVAYVQDALKQSGLSYEQAWAAFLAFPAPAQAAFGRQVLATEFAAQYLSGPKPDAATLRAALQKAFEQRQADLLRAADAALAAGGTLTLPGRETLSGSALADYAASIRTLSFARLDTDATVAARMASLAQVRSGWRELAAASVGSTVGALAALAPADPKWQAYQAALNDFSGPRFEAYRARVLATETADAGAQASNFGRASLPMRLALFDQGFQAAELAGAGTFTARPVWPGAAPLFSYSGTLDMTQSSVITRRGGDISLVNAGGTINVGLKDNGNADTRTPKGVITLGGGDVFGYAKGDFQVNNQRVFVVGSGNMNIWSSGGDIDSGRGANTAVAAPPLVARRTVDGVVFEVPPTTTGSGLGILENAAGQRQGTIGLYPAFGEILALDAFIRAPALVLGSTVKGADNLIAQSVGGAAAIATAPALNVAPPASTSAESRSNESQAAARGAETRPRPSLLTVELLGIGSEGKDEQCEERDPVTRKCLRPASPAAPAR